MLSYLDFFDYHQKRMAVLEEKYRKEIVELEDRCEALEEKIKNAKLEDRCESLEEKIKAIEKKLPDF